MKISKSIIGVVALMLMGSYSAAANAFVYAPASASMQNEETVSVEGIKPLGYYEKQLEIAELDFYKIYNSYADVDKFKVICRREFKQSSLFKQKACYPKYFLERLSQETQKSMRTSFFEDISIKKITNFPTHDRIDELTADVRAEALSYVENLVKENPELLNRLLKMQSARVKYEAKRASER